MSQFPPHIQIQVLSPIDAPGGGAVHARGIALALVQRGCSVSVLCTGREPDAALDERLDIRACRPGNLPVFWRWPPLGTLPLWMRIVRRDTLDVDAVVALSPVLAVATRLARPRLPVVLCPAAIDACEQPHAALSMFQRIERRAFRSVHGVLFPADSVGASAARALGVEPRRWDACPLGVDPRRLAAHVDMRRAFRIPPSDFVLLTVGALNQNKGQGLILDALQQCVRPDWWWIVVGDGPGRAELQRKLRGTELERRVIIRRGGPWVGDWYAAADALVGASRCETFGLAIAESLCAGRPVVIPRDERGAVLSPLAEWVDRHECGGTFKRGDSASLARAISSLADARYGWRAARTRVARAATQCFSWDRYVDRLLGLLALGERSPAVPSRHDGGALCAAPESTESADGLVCTAGDAVAR